MKIITVPNPILNQVSKPVLKLDKEIRALLVDMQETMRKQQFPESVGLSAVQIGKLWRVMIIQTELNNEAEFIINPEILEKIAYSDEEYAKISKDKNRPLEGCLSIPGLYSPIRRYKKIRACYLDHNWQKKDSWFEGFRGVVFQHEFDHLEGILFTQRALEQGAPIYKESKGKLVEVEL